MVQKLRALAALPGNLGLTPRASSSILLACFMLRQCWIGQVNPVTCCSKLLLLPSFEPNSKVFHFIIFQPLRTAITSLPNLVFSKLQSSIHYFYRAPTIKISPRWLRAGLLTLVSDCVIRNRRGQLLPCSAWYLSMKGASLVSTGSLKQGKPKDLFFSASYNTGRTELVMYGLFIWHIAASILCPQHTVFSYSSHL